MNRKDFIQKVATATTGFFIVPRNVLGKGFVAPSDQLYVGAIGAGNRGYFNIEKINSFKHARVVSLCDVDDRMGIDARKLIPKAVYYNDFRLMMAKEKNHIDAIVISIPDHNHAIASIAAMQFGKHVYCESPLCHDIYESRILAEAAQKYRITTQVGNQGSSDNDSKKIIEWVKKGLIGEVSKVHVWTNNRLISEKKELLAKTNAVSKELEWLLWLGTAPKREFSNKYLHGGWRPYVDFGTGSLGNDGPHIVDAPLKALGLTAPVSVQIGTGILSSDFDEPELYPERITLHYLFHRENASSIELIWYDGGNRPERPKELLEGEQMGDARGGILFEGSKYKLIAGYFGKDPKILPTSQMKNLVFEHDVQVNDHHENWIKACIDGDATNLTSNFSKAGKLTETLLLGNVALRSYYKKPRKRFPEDLTLHWDSKNLKVSNFEDANAFIKRQYSSGWSLI